MNGIFTVVISIIGITVIFLGIIWLGFQIEPESFPPHPEKTKDEGIVKVPPDIPEPVKRYYEAASGIHVPVIRSAVVWGKAKLRIIGIWMPVRSKTYYFSGQAFHRYMEVTWFGWTLLKVSDVYRNGKGFTKIEGMLNKTETGEKIDQGSNLALWGEIIFIPSVPLTDPRARWEAIDDGSARLVVPFGEKNDSLDFKFDPKTDMITQISAMRYKGQNEQKTPCLINVTEWMTSHYVKIPSRFSVTWEDEGSPWSYWTVEDVEYNVDVGEMINETQELGRVMR